MKVARLLSQGEALPQAAMGWNAVALNVLPVFNPTMGYVNYVVPAVFVLILHQVLLMGTGILGATQNQRSRRGESGYWQHAPVPALLLARTLVVGALFVLPVTYFFGFCFDHYGIARTAVPGELWLFTLPFLLATTWLGIVLGALFTRRDLPTQVVLVSSLPLVFWPALSGPLSSSRPPQLAGPVGTEHAGHRGIPAPQSDGGRLCPGLPLLVAVVGTGAAVWRSGVLVAPLASTVPCNAAG